MTSLCFWLWAVAIVVLACTLQWPSKIIEFAQTNDLVMRDTVDNIRIVDGLERARTWGDTLQWWYGPWVATPQVDFYRPLTSLLWWLEFHALGGRAHAALGFTLIHLASHCAACLLLLGFLRRLVGDRTALLSVGIWATGLMSYLSLLTPVEALQYWRDDPDLWVTIALTLTLSALLSYWQSGRRRFLLGAVLAQVMAITIKEMAYVGPLLAAAMLWHQLPRPNFLALSARLRSLAWLFAMVPIAFVYRCWALQGLGFRFGTNGSWFGRWLLAVGGRPLNLLLYYEIAPVGVAIGYFAILALFHRRFAWAVGLGMASAILIALHDSLSGFEMETFYRLLALSLFPVDGAQLYWDSLAAIIIIASWVICFRTRNRDQFFGFAWMVLAYIPLMTAPITSHALYLPSVGWGIWMAAVLRHLWRALLVRRNERRLNPNEVACSQAA